ncbi:MAG: hypothetical protein QOI80_2526, partial [Solirubrobacteraceae bacterium]|nr:hypothetical protein [Solirubrobacteraceae bacterium]
VEIERNTAKFDLALLVLKSADGLRITFEYSTELFEAETMDRMLGHYETLLRAAVADPERRVSALPLGTAEERAASLAAGRATAPDQAVECLHVQFARHAQRAPHAPAVVHEGVLLTYGDLDRRANQLAHRLRRLGVGRETLVALCFERSVEMIVAVLAVLKAGGAYVPMDPSYPAERLGYVLGDTRAPVLLTQERLVDRLPRHEAAIICLDGDTAGLRGEPDGSPDVAVAPGDLAYVIYTSGSTGTPKGVQVEHGNVARLFTATDAWFGFGEGDIWCMLHSYAFDFSVWEMWGALLYGGKLVIPSLTTVRAPDALALMLAKERVTVLNATPSLFVGALDALLAVADDLSVRSVIFGGEALRPAALGPWFDRFGDDGPELVNMYGITETTVHVTYQPIRRDAVGRPGSPIGRPIPDLELHVLDPAGEPTPVGVPGEIHVGGAGVARGYLHRPELTAERFVENPHGPGRLYRSGDRARRLADGGVDYLGRSDDQVKVRGYRIELGEIESTLLAHDGVAEAVVLPIEVRQGDVRLAAYVVPDRPDADLKGLTTALHGYLQASLPPHMVPASLRTVERLELTTNGKLDRRALPAPDWGAASVSIPPQTPTEVALAELWREILSVASVGSRDGFFALGGHSMLAVRLFDAIEQHFGVRLALAQLFSSDTLADLAAAIDAELRPERAWSAIVPLRGSGARPPLFVVSLANRNSDFLPYRQLIERLGNDQPVYGLQSPGMDGRTLPIGVVEDLAAHYVRELRAFQPSGPYLLFGLTFAGVVAYEVARQLEQQGERPALVAGINITPQNLQRRHSELPTGPRAWPPYVATRARNLEHKLGIRYYEYLMRHGGRRPRRSPWDLQYMASS